MNMKTLMVLGMTVAAGASLAGGVPLRDATVVVPDGYYQGRFLHNDAAGAVLDLTNALGKVTGGKYKVVKESQFKDKSQIANCTGASANCTGAGANCTGASANCTGASANRSSQLSFIYLGDTAAARTAGAAEDSLKNGEAKVLVKDGAVYIWAKTEWGVTRGVIEFLRRSVDYWYLTLSGDDPFVFNPDATAPEDAYCVRTWLQDYTIYHGMFSYSRYPETKQKWVDYSRRLGIYHNAGGDPKYTLTSRAPSGHSTFAYLPPKKYFKDHPEYFALRDEGGKLHRSAAASAGGQLCYTNPDTRRICYEALRNFVIADRRRTAGTRPASTTSRSRTSRAASSASARTASRWPRSTTATAATGTAATRASSSR